MLQRNTNVLWRELDGEAVLLNPTAGYSYTLNAVGTFIWKLLDGTHTNQDIARAICQSYEVSYEQALQDVEQIIGDLRANHLLLDAVASQPVTQS